MMDHKISQYFSQFTRLLQRLLVFQTQSQNWDLKGFLEKASFMGNHSRSSKLAWINNSRIGVEFKGSCLKQDKVTFTPNNAVNFIIVYELVRWYKDLSTDFTLKNCFFGAVVN